MMIGNILLLFPVLRLQQKKVNEVLDTDIDIKNADNPDFTPLSSGEVAFENVSFGYSGDKSVGGAQRNSFHAPSGKNHRYPWLHRFR